MAQTQGNGTTGTDGARRRWRVPALLTAAVLAGSALTFGLTAPAASAADTKATLTGTGVVSATYPLGGNTVWVAPGTSLTLDAQLAKADLSGTVLDAVGGLLGGLVNSLVGLQATVDLSSVGKGTVVLGSGNGAQPSVTTAALAKGVYPFTFSFSSVTSGGLLGGQDVAPLDGNILSPLGISLNAQNQYQGYIVADTKSPCSAQVCVSLQTPKLSVAPSLPVVGQLPTVSVPGVTVNIPVPGVPTVSVGGGSGSGGTGGTGGGTGGTGTTAPTAPGSTTTTTTTNPYGYTAPGCTGPCLVVPRGGGSGGRVGNAADVTLGQLGSTGSTSGSGSTSNSAAGSASQAAAAGANPLAAGGQQLAVDPAFTGDAEAAAGGGATGTPMPTTLAIVAAGALAGVATLWFARRRLASS